MLRKTFIALAIGLTLAGCGAKDEPYKEVKRAPEEKEWSTFSTPDLWLYVPSTGDAPRYASNMDPFFQGEEKVVQLRFVDGALRVMEVDQDKTSTESESRWNDVAPVLEIPGRYSDYRCALDKYGECTNQEEENNDANVAWDKKRYFIPDFKNIRDIEVNINQVWFHDDRVRETGSPRVVRWEMDAENGVINVEVERTFTVTPDNLTELSSSNSFTTSFYYSLVKLDKLATQGYKPIRYNVDEQSEFGFFTTDFSKLDNQGMPSDGSSRAYLNRFNPDKTSIDYYLSDTFFKPENKLFLDETLSTVELLNRSLQGTGVPALRIANPDAPTGRMVGDLRNNMINLIDRPLANGLLGYGPSVANPLTGEIVQAHVNQYSGVIKTTVPRVWNNLARSYQRGDFAAAGAVGYAGVDFEKLASEAPASKVTAELDEQQIAEAGKQFAKRKMAFEPFNAKLSLKHPTEETSLAERAKIEEQRLRRWTEKDCAFGEEAIWVSATEKGIIKGIDYTDPALYVDGIPEQHHLKRWHDLSREQQAQISDAVSAHVYRSTLVHELGHNLGLRHNFAGSSDKANFYSHEQLHELGLEMEKIPAYSSIMDYAASEFDELPVFGPYDRAALRFAYNRQIEVNYGLYNQNGPVLDDANQPKKSMELVDLNGLDSAYYRGDAGVKYGPLNYVTKVLVNPQAAGSELPSYISTWSSVPGLVDTLAYASASDRPARRSYSFCTDGNVSLNSNCKRFDEGSDLYEMMQFKRQSYFDSYERRNTRYDRQDFWSHDLASYTVRRFGEFSEVRDFLEDYERIDRLLVDNYTTGGSAPGEFLGSLVLNKNYCGNTGKADAWFCKYGQAAVEAANFLVDVVARPDKVCELKDADGAVTQKPMGELFELVKFDMPSGKAMPSSCFDEDFEVALSKMPMEYSVLSETRDGAPLNSVGTNSPDHPYSNELDVIGTWPDKLLAMEYLVNHYSNRYTEEGQAMSLVDLPGVRSRLLALVNAMALEQPSPEPVVFVDRDGQIVAPHEPYTWKRSSQLESLSPDLFFLRRHFALPTAANVGLNKAVLAQIPNFAATSDSDMQASARSLIDYVSLPTNAYDSVSGRKVEYQGKVYNIDSSNVLANRLVDYKFINTQSMADYLNTLDADSYATVTQHATAVFANLFELSSLMASNPQLLDLVDGAARIDSATVKWLMDAERAGQAFDASLAKLTRTSSGKYNSPVATGVSYNRADLAMLWSGTRSMRTSLKAQFHDLVAGWVVQLSEDLATLRADSTLSAAEKPLWAPGKVQGMFVTLAADADINSADSSRFEQGLSQLTRNVD